MAAMYQYVINRIDKGEKDEKVSTDRDGNQHITLRVHGGVKLEIWNFRPYTFTWGDIFGLAEGLYELIVFKLAKFEFSLSNGIRIGRGEMTIE